MTGKEKLIKEIIENYCPSRFGLIETKDCRIQDCQEYWQQALKKEYPDES